VRAGKVNAGVHVETSGGNIEIAVPAGIGASIDAHTSGGDVVCDLPVTVSGRVSEGTIRGTVNGGGNKIIARTSGGDIRIRATQ
jgi:lia operon protein LiaG